MKQEKILIRRDSGAERKFLTFVQETVDKGNSLIELLNSSQNFMRITTMDEVASLIENPLAYYDGILAGNITHDERLEVNMKSLAELYNIPRSKYLEGLGLPEDQVANCSTCGTGPERVILKKKKVLSYGQFKDHYPFILLENGTLIINKSNVEAYSDLFNCYASTPAQIELVTYYKTLAKTLNEAIEYHKLSISNIQGLAKMFNFLILDNQLILNDIYIADTIKYLE